MTRHHIACVGHPTYHTSDPRAERSEPLLCRHCTWSTVLKDVLARALLQRRTTSTAASVQKKAPNPIPLGRELNSPGATLPALRQTGTVSLSHGSLVSGIRTCPSGVLSEVQGLVRSRLPHQAMVRDHLLNWTRDDIDPKHYGDQKLRFQNQRKDWNYH